MENSFFLHLVGKKSFSLHSVSFPYQAFQIDNGSGSEAVIDNGVGELSCMATASAGDDNGVTFC